MPPNHQQYIQWNGDRFRKWAANISPNTTTVVKAILTGYKVEQQGYRACMALLKLSDQYSAEARYKKAFLTLTKSFAVRFFQVASGWPHLFSCQSPKSFKVPCLPPFYLWSVMVDNIRKTIPKIKAAEYVGDYCVKSL